MSKARAQMEEQDDEIKKLNELMLNAKCHAIRDAQLKEKAEIKQAMEEEEVRGVWCDIVCVCVGRGGGGVRGRERREAGDRGYIDKKNKAQISCSHIITFLQRRLDVMMEIERQKALQEFEERGTYI